MGYFLAMCLISCLTGLSARDGMWSALTYRKSNSRNKKEWKQLMRTQKIFCFPIPKQLEIYAPWHMKFFAWVRIINFFSVLLLGLAFLLFHDFDKIRKILYTALAVKLVAVDLVFFFYLLLHTSGKTKQWEFDKARKP